jgi:class 3 adenylate cyclase
MSTEMAHVLFMDTVGYTLHSMEEQSRLTRELREVVRGTAEFQRATASAELTAIDTGDGMALAFFKDPIAPLQCAVEVGRALRNHPHLRIRMGVHSGPVSRVTDINQQENLSGGGLNTAQRVMSCGDAGHILLSRSVAETISEFESWSMCLHDLGEATVKHGQKLHLYNLFLGEIGNPHVPAALQAPTVAAVAVVQAPAPTVRVTAENVGGGRQVALLYKRSARLDEQALRLLETELTGAGFSVFVDRHMAIGVEWAAEIERQVRTSYAVIPLLSKASIGSEMLEYEVETAHRASQKQAGRPLILPVRVNFAEPLEEPLAAILNPLNHASWSSPADDRSLVEQILNSLVNPPHSAMERIKLENLGGAVPLDSQFYIVRPTDHEFVSAVARRDSIVLVKGARQMGKTSLLARCLQEARNSGAKVVLTDYQALNTAHLQSPETLFLSLAESIADQLDLDVLPDDVWNQRRGANMNLERFLRKEVLGSFDGPLVWAMDEVDRLFSCDFGSEVFGLFRSWHNRRSLDPSGPWSRVTLAIAYATEAHLFISDLNQSPFNVGTRISLNDFDMEHVAEVNRRYGSPLRSEEEVARFFSLVGGQPYLVRRGLTEMVAQGIGLPAIEASSAKDEGIFGDHLRRLLISLSHDPILLEVMRGVLAGKGCPTPETFYRLRSAGIVRGESASVAVARCKLYATYLSDHIL